MFILNYPRFQQIICLLIVALSLYSCKKSSSDTQRAEPSQEHIYFSANGIKDTVAACCSPANYFNYKDSAATNINPASIYIYGLGDNGSAGIGFTSANIAAGSTQTLTYYSSGGPAGTAGFTYYPSSSGVHITEYGTTGQYISGNFTCSFTSVFDHNPYNVTCSFRIKRK